MSLEVIGAGFGRTGTMSLKVALEDLGYGPCYHMIELFEHPNHVERWEAVARPCATLTTDGNGPVVTGGVNPLLLSIRG